ncbi:MAG: saccharopine dehydrogenase NADP-binding domain-containing protein [Blastomonas sp.]|nr:saccharopine dehydrogenase NADP-binding domain-containing protein [Blastomonas sp.]
MTKDLLILGAGGIGTAAARFAAENPHLGRLTVADLSLAAAEAAAAVTGGRAQPHSIDVTDPQALAVLLGSVDAVINCVGPYYRFGPPVLTAAIAAGITYIDVCDDWDATLAMLEQDAAAKGRGVTAIIGMGASPGTANLIAAQVASLVTNPKRLITGWSLDDDPGDPGGAANEHWLHQATGTIRVWRGGRYVDETPLCDVPVALPGFPARRALTIGHPEAVTLPRVFSGLDTCLNVMTLPGGLEELLLRAVGLVENDGMSFRDAGIAAFSNYVPGAGPHLPEYPGVWALAEGETQRAAAWIPKYGRLEGIHPVTAAPTVAAFNLLMRGIAAQAGVLTPEEAFAPFDYFAELARIAEVSGDYVHAVVEAASDAR